MKQKKVLFLLSGIPGSGKTTYIKKEMEKAKLKANILHVSRDEIRFSLLKEGEDYFAHEDEVFEIFINQIKDGLMKYDCVYADATHINERSRNKTLDRLNLNDVDIIPISFELPLETCLAQNENRRDNSLTYVPRSVIRRMYNSLVPPRQNEKYKYKNILVVGEWRIK